MSGPSSISPPFIFPFAFLSFLFKDKEKAQRKAGINNGGRKKIEVWPRRFLSRENAGGYFCLGFLGRSFSYSRRLYFQGQRKTGTMRIKRQTPQKKKAKTYFPLIEISCLGIERKTIHNYAPINKAGRKNIN